MKKCPAVHITHTVAGVMCTDAHRRQSVFGASVGDAGCAYAALPRRIFVV